MNLPKFPHSAMFIGVTACGKTEFLLKLLETVSPCIMCVQYSGGTQYRGGIQYHGGVQYCGGYHEYRGGYLEYRGGVQYRGGYHDKCGGYLEYHGGRSVQWGIS